MCSIDRWQSKTLVAVAVGALLGMACPAPAGPSVIHVDTDATGANDGASWTDAFVFLQDGLDAAISGDQIWVAEGTYHPDDGLSVTGGDRSATFQLINGVSVYGGFTGVETMLSQRDPATNVTTLSGDLIGNDGPDFADNVENSYHVVTGSGTDATAILDSFTIQDGNANGSGDDFFGGGMLVSTSTLSGHPTVGNCVFADNSAGRGGGANATESDAEFTGCIFRDNRATNASGGGMATLGNVSALMLLNCWFTGNAAPSTSGGGVFAGGQQTLVNCVFSGNSAQNGGAIGTLGSNTSLTLVNCTLSSNSALLSNAGGIQADPLDASVVTNCILWGNTNASGADEAAQLIVGPAANVTHSLIQGLSTLAGGVGNIDADPLFVDADGLDNTIGTVDDDLRLSAGSPCIDVADNTVLGITVDLDGNLRRTDDPGTTDGGNGIAPIVDMGAYEFGSIAVPIVFVDKTVVGGANNGTSWSNAFVELQDALDFAAGSLGFTPEIWVAAGTYNPDDGLSVTGGGPQRDVSTHQRGGRLRRVYGRRDHAQPA
ncbi:MAG: right-handed parallel beta-helix repeat-containing protein [Phycisphaerae bacterium]